ncbi:MAG: pyroglutamyl-peptidase I, partial [Pseudolabrys sp.]|nr:pyroglutamyl-peptidase I [Pseudolabrys sp.]
MPTILVTGFGPFPGAAVNPTGALVRSLAHIAKPPGLKLKVATHVFETSYDAVDDELPALGKKHRPDALLMFGLATRRSKLSIETVARNSLGRAPDAIGHRPGARTIAAGMPLRQMMATPAQALLAAASAAKVPAAISRNAGNYLCNYLCWNATVLTAKRNGPRYAAFVHVPELRPGGRIDAV